MQIQCPKCQRQLRVADTAAGKLVRCPGCGGTFQAVDTVEEYVQTKPPPPPARRPVAEDEPPPRRRREEVEEDDRPRRRRDEDDYDDRPRSRRKSYDDDYDEDDIDNYKSNRKEARRVGRSAGVWLILAGIVVLVTVVFNLISNFVVSANLAAAGGPFAQAGGPFGNAFQAGRIAGMIGCGLVALVGALFEFQAVACLRQFRGKGIVVTAIVFGFVFGVLFGIGFILNVIGLSAVLRLFGGTMAAITVVQLVLGGLTCFFNLFAAIKSIIVLNNKAVSRAFRS
jgi:predicted Zn finger-like uncharacterized protein